MADAGDPGGGTGGAGATVSARTVRRAVLGVCVAGIAGMIVSSIQASTAAALTFGLVTATAVLCLIVATAVEGGGEAPSGHSARVEELVARLVDAGADEATVRELVREAGRRGGADASPGDPRPAEQAGTG